MAVRYVGHVMIVVTFPKRENEGEPDTVEWDMYQLSTEESHVHFNPPTSDQQLSVTES